MKKAITKILALALALFSLLSLSGCYSIKSGKMRRVEGTYKLTAYSTKVNNLEENGIVMYLVINGDGTGYYAYSDNETEAYYDTVSVRFISDTEKSGYYSYVEIDFTGDGNYTKLGVYSSLKTKTLNSSIPRYTGGILNGDFRLDYYESVTFTRVSGKTDLSYVKSAMGDIPAK